MNFISIGIAFLYFLTPISGINIGENYSIRGVGQWFFLLICLLSIRRAKILSNVEKKFLLYSIIFIITCFISCLWCPDFGKGMIYIFQGPIIRTFVFTILLLKYISTNKQLDMAITAYVWGTILLAILAVFSFKNIVIMNSMYNLGVSDMRNTVLGMDQNQFTLVMNLGIILSLRCLEVERRKVIKMLYLIGILFMVFVIPTTGSRGGVLTTLFLFLCYFSLPGRRKWLFYSFPLIALLVISSLVVLPESILNRLLDSGNQISAGDMSGRGLIWAHLLSCYFDQNIYLMFFGTGPCGVAHLMASKFGFYGISDAHNVYLQHVIESGIMFFPLYLATLFYPLKAAWHAWKFNREYAFIVSIMIVYISGFSFNFHLTMEGALIVVLALKSACLSQYSENYANKF